MKQMFTQEAHHVNMETEIRVMHLQATENQRLLVNTRS